MGKDGTRDKTGSQVIDNGELVMPERMIQSKTRSQAVLFMLSTLTLIFSVLDAVESAERQRIPWTESKLVGAPDPPLPYRAVRAYEKLPLFAPVYLRRFRFVCNLRQAVTPPPRFSVRLSPRSFPNRI